MVASRKPPEPSPGPGDGVALTRMQRRVLETLRAGAAAGAEPPTLDALCRALGLVSRGSLHKHVRALVAAGLVAPMRGLARGVRLTPSGAAVPPATARGAEPLPAAQPSAPLRRLPLAGRVAAGRPIEAIEDAEPVEVPAALAGRGESYVLEVRGDSMTGAGILDGDRVVIEARSHARDGEIVVALIDGAEATLKRIEQRPGAVLLHAAHDGYPPWVLDPERVSIRGVVTGLMRRYR